MIEQITYNIRIKTSFFCALILLFGSLYTQGQTKNLIGFLPSINYNQRLNTLWDINFRLESRHFILQAPSLSSDNFAYDYSLTDLTVLAGKKAGLDGKLVFGMLSRFEPGGMVYRSIQQYIVKSRLLSFRVAHRIASDQTFSVLESPEFRLRYRLSTELPFSGIKLDPKEFYFKLNTEALNSLQSDVYDLELRLVTNIGYELSNGDKIEIGLDN